MNNSYQTLALRRQILQAVLAELDNELESQSHSCIADLYGKAQGVIESSELPCEQKWEGVSVICRLRGRHEKKNKASYTREDVRGESALIRAELEQICREIETFYSRTVARCSIKMDGFKELGSPFPKQRSSQEG